MIPNKHRNRPQFSSFLVAAIAALACLAVPAIAQAADELILFEEEGDGVWTIKPNGDDETEVRATGYGPRFSPDGGKIAFVDANGGDQSVYVMNADGTGASAISPASPDDFGGALDWVPDGSKVIFEREFSLWSVAAAGGAPTELTDSGSDSHDYPIVSPDGTKIGFQDQDDFSIGLMTIAGAGVNNDVTSPGIDDIDVPLDTTPDGKLLYMRVTDDGVAAPTAQLRKIGFGGGGDAFVANAPNPDEAAGYRYSPDGTELVWDDEGDSDQLRTGAPGTAGTELPVTEIPAFPDWAEVSKAIVVNDAGDDPDADTGTEECDTDEDTAGKQCTLRAAIETVNAAGGGPASKPRPISFDLGNGAEPMIAVESALPAIEVPVELDGSVGEAGKARIDGAGAGAGADGLRLLGGGSRVHDMVVTGFGRDGIVIDGGSRTMLGNNAVGTLADGSCPAVCVPGNGRSGVRIRDGATRSWVGDPMALTRQEKDDLRADGEYVPGPNTIANNGDDAITIVNGRANDVAGNRMHDNGDLGIDLGADGLSPNDNRDIDSGPNDLLNAPTATSSFLQAEIGDREIRSGRGIFSGRPNQDLRFVAYWLGGCDAPYAEEGEIPAYSYPFETDEKGFAGLPTTKADLGPGKPIAVALALAVVDSEGNTSELSNCVADDSDDDGIDDGFEREGADLDHDGEADVPLDRLGAVVGKADIFVEVDWTRGHALAAEGLSRVQEAFADAPRENADGSSGIRLHIDNGRRSQLLGGGRWGADSRGGEVPAAEAEYPLEGKWAGFDKVKAAHFDRDRAPFFRYALSVRKLYRPSAETTLGEARRTDLQYEDGEDIKTGTDFALGLGPFCSPAGSDCPGPVDAQAGGFMHELGHLLGLTHGGADDLLDKPNFFSVMNYLYTAGTLLPSESPSSATAPILDYSRSGPPPGGGPGGTVATLDEEDIDESAGIVATGDAANYSALRGCNDDSRPGSSVYVLVPKMNEPVDWDCDGEINPPYILDLNADGKDSKLATVPEWDRVNLFGGAVGGKYVQGGGEPVPESAGGLSLRHFTETLPVLLGDEQAPEVRIETLVSSPTEAQLEISASDDKQLDSLVVTVDGEQHVVEAVGSLGGNGGVNLSAVTDEVTLGRGTHLVSAVAFDRAMHQSDLVERTVTVGLPPDVRAPAGVVDVKGRARAGKPIKLEVRSDEDATVTASGSQKQAGKPGKKRRSLAVGIARKGKNPKKVKVPMKTVRVEAAAGVPATLKLKPQGKKGKKAAKKLKKAVKKGAKAKAKLKVVFTDLSGNTSTKNLVLKLK